MAQERLSSGGSGGTTDEQEAEEATQRAVEDTPEPEQDSGGSMELDQEAINEAFGRGSSSTSGSSGTSGSGGGGSSSSGGDAPDSSDLDPGDFGAEPGQQAPETTGSGRQVSDAEQQDANAAVADVNKDVRQKQQGVEGRKDAVGQQARELEQTVLERNPELSSEDVRVVRDGRQIRTELTPQGAEQVGANPTTGEVRRRVASRNEGVDPDDIVVTRGSDGEFDVGLSDRRDRQQSAGRNVSPFITGLNIDLEPGPRSQDVFSTDVVGTSGTTTSQLRARTPRASAGESLSTTTLGADDEVGVSVADLDRETQERVNRAAVGSFAARTTTRTKEVQTQEEKFLNDILGGAPEEAQAAEESALGGLREDFSEGVERAEGGISSGVDTVASFGAAASERVTTRINEDPTIQGVVESDYAQELGRQADIAGEELRNPLTPRGERLVAGVQGSVDAGIAETQRQADIAAEELRNPLTPKGQRVVERIQAPVEEGIAETQRQADIAAEELRNPLTPKGERLVGQASDFVDEEFVQPTERNVEIAERQLANPLTRKGERLVGEASDLLDEEVVSPTERNVEIAERQLRTPLTPKGERLVGDVSEVVDDGIEETQRQSDLAAQQLANPLTPKGERVLDDVTAEGERVIDGAKEFTGGGGSRTLGGGLAGAAAAGVVAPEPVSTIGGGAVLGGIALAGIAGAAATGRANEVLDDDGDGRATRIGSGEGVSGSELEVPEEGTAVVQSELDVSDGPVFGSELGVGSGNFQRNEISIPDRGFSGTSGEISVPALGASQLSQQIRRGRQRERQREREDNPFRRDPDGADEDELEEILRGPGDVTIEEEERLEESREQTLRRDRERFTERRLDELRSATDGEADESPEDRFREAERSTVLSRTGAGPRSGPVTGVGPGQQSGVQSDVDTDVLGRADVTQVQRQLQLQDQTQLQRQQQAQRLAQPQAFAEPSLTTTVNSGEFLNPNEFVEVTENGTGRPGGNGRPRARRARLDFDPEQDTDDLDGLDEFDNSLQINPVTAPDELDEALQLDGGR